MDFLIAGSAAVCAGFFSNPLDVLKVRMQLQGELHARGEFTTHYKNVIQAAIAIAENEGLTALQKGLYATLPLQFCMNGVRLGIFQWADSRKYMHDQNGNKIFYKQVFVGGIGGVIGQYVSSPLFLIKTHLQAQAATAIAVGHQHQHSGLGKALQTIYKEHGIRGLYRGAGAAIPRAFIGSTSQLTAFNYSKAYFQTFDYFKNKELLVSFLGSMVGGVVISVMMTPFDLVMTRLYNQSVDEKGRGKLYKNYMDCVLKIYKTEGASAFYKGVGPMYLRLGPHTVLCLVFWDEFKGLYDKYWL